MRQIVILAMIGVLLSACSSSDEGMEKKEVVIAPDAKCLVAVVKGWGRGSSTLNTNIFQKPLPCKEAIERAEHLEEVAKEMFPFRKIGEGWARRYYYPYPVSVGNEK